MMKIIVKHQGEASVISLTGNVTIPDRERLKKKFAEEIERSRSVEVRLAKASTVDLSLLELLCSAHNSALRMGKQFAASGAQPAFLSYVFEHAGFAHYRGCGRNGKTECLWKEMAEEAARL
jgi:anti-anti-sigma regulatory factor